MEKGSCAARAGVWFVTKEEIRHLKKKLTIIKIVSQMEILFFLLLLLPIFYLSFVNRASGDDYGYGTYTRAAWMGSHSLVAVGRAVWQTIRQFYYGWQGTWFSIFVFSLQPEVFHDDAYVIVAFLMLFLWIGSTLYLFWQILCRNMKLDKWSYLLVTVCFLIISIEFIPSYKSSIFWFNGCAHYMLPFAMCQMVAAWLLRYVEAYQVRYLIGIVVFMTLLGGSNYLAALFALIVTFYVGIAVWMLKRDKRILALLLPVFTELVGLVISMRAPGNRVRGGEDFGFSIRKCIETIGYSFRKGIGDIGTYCRERPMIFVGLLFLFLSLIMIYCVTDVSFRFQHPVWLALMLFCLYSAMQAPGIYAGVPVSGGVPNMIFQVFLLMASGMLLIVAERLAGWMKGRWGEGIGWKVFYRIAVPGILLCLILAFLCKGNIKISTSYACLRYIASGEAADYKEQMDLQTRLMEAGETENVVVPGINDEQGPLMHMPVTEDSTRYTNMVTAQFYGKKSVISIERPKWMEIYGD